MSEVVHPNHYGGDVPEEPIKVIRLWRLNFALGNAVKYIARAGKKDVDKTVVDLEKARFYLDDEIKAIKHTGFISASSRTPFALVDERDLKALMRAIGDDERADEVLMRLQRDLMVAGDVIVS